MKIDMHVHSIYSPDGRVSVEDVLRIARKKGLGGIAITDHNEMKGALKAKKLGIIPVIVGEEVSTLRGHVLAYEIDCLIPRGLSVEETIEKIHDCGGYAVAAHPYRFWSGIGENEVIKNSKKFDAVEIFNGRCKISSNRKANELALKLNEGFTAGSDAHFDYEIGKAGIIADCEIDELWKCIINREVGIFGKPRSGKETIKYVKKSVSEWIKRGFKRI